MHIDAHRSSSKHSKKNPYILSPDRHLDDMAKGEWISKIIRASFCFVPAPPNSKDALGPQVIRRWNFAALLQYFETSLRSETPSCGCLEVLSFFEMSKCRSQRRCYILPYMLWCHSADTVASLRPSLTSDCQREHFHLSQAVCSVQSDTSTEIGRPNGNWAMGIISQQLATK